MKGSSRSAARTNLAVRMLMSRPSGWIAWASRSSSILDGAVGELGKRFPRAELGRRYFLPEPFARSSESAASPCLDAAGCRS